MTYSLVARCRRTGMFGAAVVSSSPAVAARCIFAEQEVGAVATQNLTDPALGTRTLELMRGGAGAIEAVAILREAHPHMAWRQLIAVDGNGRSAAHSGERVQPAAGEARALDVACIGNLLTDGAAPAAAVATFRETAGHLGDRIIAALRAARDADGALERMRSAGMKLVRDMPWPVADLRVDWTDGEPVEELAALWARYRPQLDAFVARALDPEHAQPAPPDLKAG
jgi:uncharacterized Ntn-hydrolase superfamily protein